MLNSKTRFPGLSYLYRRESHVSNRESSDVPAVSEPFDLGFVAALILALPSAISLWHRGFLFTDDGLLHVFRVVELDVLLRRLMDIPCPDPRPASFLLSPSCNVLARFFPRWAPDLYGGYGYPIFTFSGPSTIYLTEGIHLLGWSFVDAHKIVLALGLVLCGPAMYAAARIIGDRRGALIAAAIYTYAPVHALNTYQRGDVAEAFAAWLMPAVTAALWGIVNHPTRGRLAVGALVLAVLLVTHNLTTLIVAPAIATLVLAHLATVGSWSRAARATGALVITVGLGLALSDFFWVPVVLEKSFVHLERSYSSLGYIWSDNFLSWFDLFAGVSWSTVPWLNSPRSYGLGWGLLG